MVVIGAVAGPMCRSPSAHPQALLELQLSLAYPLMGMVRLLVLALILAGCGGAAAFPDGAAIDASSTPDGGPHDAMVGVAGAYQPCTIADGCMDPGYECVDVPWTWVGEFDRLCLPTCATSAECRFGMICYPPGGGLLGADYAPIAGHCYQSLCGEDTANGQTGGTCMLGAEVGAPLAEQYSGTCVSIHDGHLGYCLDAGDLQPGAPCSMGLHDEPHCRADSLCVHPKNEDTRCVQMCDPRDLLDGLPTTCEQAGFSCYDGSWVHHRADGAAWARTIGMCVQATACSLLEPNTCAPEGVLPRGCMATNPIRPTGICHLAGTGEVQRGGACVDPWSTQPAAEECIAGTWCNVVGPAPLTCQAACDLGPTPAVDCNEIVTGSTCQAALFFPGEDSLVGTTDDITTVEWGTCQ